MGNKKKWQFCNGYVIIQIEGVYPERLATLLKGAGVPLWDLHRLETGGLVCTLPARDFRRLRQLNRRCRCRVHIRKKGGAPFRLKALWRRRVLILGMALTLLAVTWCSHRIWFVEVQGCRRMDQGVLLEALREQGICPGRDVRKLPLSDLADLVAARYEELAFVELHVDGIFLRVRAREDYTVYCDGQALTAEDKVESGIRMEVAQYLPNGVTAPTECVYEVSRLSGQPEFTCVDHRGRPVALTEENGQLTAGINYDELDDETRAYVARVDKCLALYTADDQTFMEMSKYLVKDSEAYKAMRAMESGWFTLHTSYRFANMVVENVQFYGDSVMSCDVSLTFIIVAKKDNSEKSYDSHYTFYFQKKGDKWLLYNYVTI